MAETAAPCILVADDDEGNRTLLDRLLATRGYRVRMAEDGDAALRMAQEPDVDLVLMDQMMPGLTGTQVVERLRAVGADVPVIMLTAVGAPPQIAEALRLGADDYVTKPFSPMVLLARVERRLRPPRPRPEPARAVTTSPPEPIVRPEPPTAAGFTSFFGRMLRGMGIGPSAPEPREPSLGTTLSSRYRLTSVIGRGAFGAVYRARHLDLETDVAVKVLRPDAAATDLGVSALEAFRREAVRACRVRHPNAVRVSDFGVTPEGSPYLVMELLTGESLEARLARIAIPPRITASIIADVLSALAAAHAFHVIHHDVKSANIMLHREAGREVVKLIDFGAAGDETQAPSALVVGSATHMAPERFGGGRASPSTDIYAVGITLYQALTREYPFNGDSYEAIQREHFKADVIPASYLCPGITEEWDRVIGRLLAMDPAARPSAEEAAELVRALR